MAAHPHSRLRAFLGNAPLRVVAVVFFAIFIPSVLVTALGLLAVYQADTFVRERSRQALGGKVTELRGQLRETWGERLDLYAAWFRNAERRLHHLAGIRRKDPCVRDLLFASGSGAGGRGKLVLVREPPPVDLWAPGQADVLRRLQELELQAGKDPAAASAALSEALRLLAEADDEGVLVEARLAAARLSQTLGDLEGSRRHLQEALERHGNTVDVTGMVRALPLLWRLLEVEVRLDLPPGRVAETARELEKALGRHETAVPTEVVRFYRDRLRSLGQGAGAGGVPAPGKAGAEAPAGDGAPGGGSGVAGAGFLGARDLPLLEPHLPGPADFAAAGKREGSPGLFRRLSAVLLGPEWRHGDVYTASFLTGGAEGIVHVFLDRQVLEAEGRALCASLGLPREALRFEDPAAHLAPEGSGPFVRALPPPLEGLSLCYEPPPGLLPEGFRGFQWIPLATYSWAVVVLVLMLIVGVAFTLRSVLRELRTARLKTDFASFISHELKTPLTAIRMYSETLLLGRVENEEERNLCLRMIDGESERLSKLIDQILQYSRLERHQKKFQFTSCNMDDVVEEAVRIFNKHQKGAPRVVEVNSVQRISKIKMDRPAMIELLLNLLSNAAKYSEADKRIVINVRESIDDISVEVVDDGIGIRKRDQKKIFEKFYRADDYLTRDVEGTGLGLAFARYVAKVHNGDIKVASQLNGGSSFTLQLKKTHVLAE